MYVSRFLMAFLAFALATAMRVPISDLATTKLQLLKNGGLAGSETTLGKLVKGTDTLVFLAKDGLLGNARVIGLVKEIAPCATAKDDAELGVEEFQTKYFNGLPLYLDAEKAVYSALGDRKITELKGTWNPFELWKGLKGIGERIKAKNLEGNFRGEGLVLGGIVVIKRGETRFTYYEESGKEIPRESIIAAVKGK